MHIGAKRGHKAEDDQEWNEKRFKIMSYLLVTGSVSEFGNINYL